MPREDWRRYVAPAAFLVAATIAILLIRSGLQAGTSRTTTTSAVGTQPHKTVSETTTTRDTTTGGTTTPASGPRFWTVKAGDTFGVISSKSGVPVATIQQLNPNVKSTSLFIGQKLRLR
ncbi:MAG TPA: LysM peptidoglycan-binding domain-containing protein [Gaiellaceae bacterium]|nr:LysM peptidoglycan-binding domain-containing protein [Gaiellaceae bacterium]